jgi:D-sedoheptulose 7-phosphate isomerase
MTEEKIMIELIRRHPLLEETREDILEAARAIVTCFRNDGKLLICGNGGSCADADHMVGELMKSFEKKRPLPEGLKKHLQSVDEELGNHMADHLQDAVPAISLCAHTSLITAISNDMEADLIFAQQVVGLGNEGDVLLAITTSGNSQNVVNAAVTARAKGLTVIGLTGQSGGRLKSYCDICLTVPALTTPEVQELHLPVYHTLCQLIEENLF